MHLLDINVWLGLAFQRHTNHVSAVAWFRTKRSALCCFCRATQSGFLRLASSPAAMKTAAVTLKGAWNAYDALLADPNIGYADEPDGVEPIWRAFTQRANRSPKLWNDAYLAAFAIAAGGYEVVTFDGGFSQFPGLTCTILT